MKNPLKTLAKIEFQTSHILYSIGGFISAIPLFTDAELVPPLKAYEAVVDVCASLLDRFQMGHLRLLGRLGLLDSEYIGKKAHEYLNGHGSLKKEANYVIKLNKEGTLNNLQTVEHLSHVSNSSDLSFDFDQASGRFYPSPYSEIAPETRREIRDILANWYDQNAASTMKELTGEQQETFAWYVDEFYKRLPVGAGERNGIVLGPPDQRDRRLFTIFNAEATGTGQALVMYERTLATIPETLARMTAETAELRRHYKYHPEEWEQVKAKRTEVRSLLKDYQKKHPAP